MVNLHGNKPYQIVLVHGGPGAIHSLAPLASVLAENYGVVEAIQSKYTINDLINELKEQIIEYCEQPIVLIGHSWGAWLSVLFTNQYPKLVHQIILIGCPPLTDDYLNEIPQRRKMNMGNNEKKAYDEIIRRLEDVNDESKQSDLKRLSEILKKSDNYEAIDEQDIEECDVEMFQSIWKEAKQLRTDGTILNQFTKCKVEMILIQGDRDPHPYLGVMEPLATSNCLAKTVILDECGHSPWNELHAKKPFYQFLTKELNTIIK